MFEGLKARRAEKKARAALTRRSVELSEDEGLIAQNAPEVAGMGFVNGGAYILDAIREWRQTATEEQCVEFAGRLKASQDTWSEDGLTMPWWGNLVVLRNYQAELAADPRS